MEQTDHSFAALRMNDNMTTPQQTSVLQTELQGSGLVGTHCHF